MWRYFQVCAMNCLFVWGFSSQSRIFLSYGDVTIAGEGLHILTSVRHSWLFSSDGSLACYTYLDTGHPFISEDPLHSHLLPSVWLWSCHFKFYALRLSRLGFEHLTLRLRDEHFNPSRYQRGCNEVSFKVLAQHKYPTNF